MNEPKKKIRIACIGDSITYGYGVGPYRETDSYPALLQDKLGKERYRVFNFGLNGRCVLHNGEEPYFKETAFSESLKLNADAYVILLGTNDAAGYNFEGAGPSGVNFKKDLEALVDSYRILPFHPKVLLLVPPEAIAFDRSEFAEEVCHNLDETIRPAVKEVAQEKGVALVDLYPLTYGHPEYLVDSVHPNKKGDEVIAEAVYRALLQAFEE